jgi:hypothetical protein
MEMNRLPPTQPANATVPSWAATMSLPKGAPMSMPRCPGPYGSGGGSNPRITGPSTGQAYVPYMGSEGERGDADEKDVAKTTAATTMDTGVTTPPWTPRRSAVRGYAIALITAMT